MKYKVILIWLLLLPFILTTSYTFSTRNNIHLPPIDNHKVLNKKIFMEVETLGNFAVIEEDVLYKINANVIKIEDNNIQTTKTIKIKKFIANIDSSFKNYEVRPLLPTTNLHSFKVITNNQNNSVLIESSVIISNSQLNEVNISIGLMYVYTVDNVFRYKEFSQLTDAEFSNFDGNEDTTVEFNIFLSNFPLQINDKSIYVKEKNYEVDLLKNYKMRHLVKKGSEVKKMKVSHKTEDENSRSNVNLKGSKRTNIINMTVENDLVYNIRYKIRTNHNSIDK